MDVFLCLFFSRKRKSEEHSASTSSKKSRTLEVEVCHLIVSPCVYPPLSRLFYFCSSFLFSISLSLLLSPIHFSNYCLVLLMLAKRSLKDIAYVLFGGLHFKCLDSFFCFFWPTVILKIIWPNKILQEKFCVKARPKIFLVSGGFP